VPGSGHFGLMTVTDTGDRVSIVWSGRDYTGAELLRHEFEVPAVVVGAGSAP